MYFVLGMLSIIAVAFIAVIVWGLLKINKQQQRIDHIQHMIAEMDRGLNDRINWNHRRIDEYDANLNRRIDETNSYIDSRIDKALSTISAKQIIKG